MSLLDRLADRAKVRLNSANVAVKITDRQTGQVLQLRFRNCGKSDTLENSNETAEARAARETLEDETDEYVRSRTREVPLSHTAAKRFILVTQNREADIGDDIVNSKPEESGV